MKHRYPPQKRSKGIVKRTLVVPASALVLSTLVGCSDPSVRYMYASKEDCAKDYLETKCTMNMDLKGMYSGPRIPESVIKKTQFSAEEKQLLGNTSQTTKVPDGVVFVEKEGQLFRKDETSGALIALSDEEQELVEYEYKTQADCASEWNAENCKPETVHENGGTKTVYRSNPFLNYFIISRMMNGPERSYTSRHVSPSVTENHNGSSSSGGGARAFSRLGTSSIKSGFSKGVSSSMHSSSSGISRGGFGRSFGGRSFGG